MLAEAITTEISKEKKPEDFNATEIIAQRGGIIAGNTRKAIEAKTAKKNSKYPECKTAQSKQ